jgi:hypothetical protein
MFAQSPLAFIEQYVKALEAELQQQQPQRGLSRTQKRWLKYCLMGILLTNQVCWAKFERAGLGGYRQGGLSWMFWWSKISWEWLLVASVRLILNHYGIHTGVLVADDTGRQRAKVTRRILATHTIYDNQTGGYFNGQRIILLLLVTPLVTLLVGFRFYRQDPMPSQWRKENQRLKNKGVKKSQRPVRPPYDPNYPSYQQLVLEMLSAFGQHHPQIKVNALVADAQYGSSTFLEPAAPFIGQRQVISQLRCNQKVRFQGHTLKVSEYFTRYPGVSQTTTLRGGQPLTLIVSSARLYVSAQRCKRLVIALKYEDEEEYRYLVATDMSWRTLDIVRAYLLRWLIAVFFEEWKLYEGWGQLAKQPGIEGSSRSLTLSLLYDHALLLHPEPTIRLKNKQPACTVGSLCERSRAEALLVWVQNLLSSERPGEQLAQLADKVKYWFPFSLSGKHLSARELGRLEPTPSLRYRVATVDR